MTFRWADFKEASGNWWVAAGLGSILGGAVASTLAIWPELRWSPMLIGLWPTNSGEWAAWAQAFGTILAVVAAAVIAFWQSHKAARQENERHLRDTDARRRAAFVTLPNDLSRLLVYAGRAFAYANYHSRQHTVQDLIYAPEFPAIDNGIFKRFREDIPFVDDVAAEAISELMSWYQVQNARLSSRASGVRVSALQAHLFDAAKLVIMINALFEYARSRGRREIELVYTDTNIRNGVLKLLPVKERGANEAPLVAQLTPLIGKPIFALDATSAT